MAAYKSRTVGTIPSNTKRAPAVSSIALGL
jgi:hypothetical protein